MGSLEVYFWMLCAIMAIVTWYAIIPLLDHGLMQTNIAWRNPAQLEKARGAALLALAVLIPSVTQSVAQVVYAAYAILIAFAILSFFGVIPTQRFANAE